MENKILQELRERTSTRAFLDRPVPEEVQQAILHAAMQAPTAGNQMLYTILNITDQALKERLAETCDHQSFIAKAPFVLVFLADFQRWYDAFDFAGCNPRLPGEGDLLLAMADACIAAQNSVVAAQSLGVGSCYIGDILEQAEIHRELLGLPNYVVPAVMVVYGYPTVQQKQRKKPARFDAHYIIQENQYKCFSAQEHEAWFRERAQRESGRPFDYRAYMNAFCKRKYLSDFSREMSRSAAVYLEKFQNR